MVKTEEYKLIEGTFPAADASKILLEIINNKINYHNLQIFSIQERFNGDASHSEKRVKELLKISKALKKTLAAAEKKGSMVEIYCPINIRVLGKQ
jgi:hypothetical protein